MTLFFSFYFIAFVELIYIYLIKWMIPKSLQLEIDKRATNWIMKSWLEHRTGKRWIVKDLNAPKDFELGNFLNSLYDSKIGK